MFSGKSDNALAVLKFLMKEHPRQCSFVLDDALLKESQDRWFAVAIVWLDGLLTFPGDGRSEETFTQQARTCKEQLVIVPLVIVDARRENMHANMIIIDREHGTFEHFEPYGTMPSGYGNPIPLQLKLKKLCASIFPNAVPAGMVIAVKHSHGIGLQARQELERKMGRLSQPPGFCLAWSALYASIRLASPNVHPMAIPAKILYTIQHSEQTDGTLTDYIDRFAVSILEKS